MSAVVQRKLQQAQQRLAEGNLDAAVSLCEAVVQRAPRNPEALWLLGTARLMQNRADLALPLLQRASDAAQGHGAVLESLGLAHLMLSRYAEAASVLQQACAIVGAPPSAHLRHGLAMLGAGRTEEAIAVLEQLSQSIPAEVDVQIGLGRAYAAASRWNDAASAFRIAEAVAPGHIDASFNLAVALAECGDYPAALTRLTSLVALQPDNVDVRDRLAALAVSLGRYAEAISQLEALVALQPQSSTHLERLAEASFQTGELERARTHAERALALDRSSATGWSVLARIAIVRADYAGAVAVLDDALEHTPSNMLSGLRMHLLHRVCDWLRWRAAWEQVEAKLHDASDLGSPFSLLSEPTTAQQQLDYTRRWAEARFGQPLPDGRPVHASAGRRLRIGYFSSDLQEHAVAHLLVEAMECHDRSRFEIFAYSYGPEDGSAMRGRLRNAFEHFIDISRTPDDRAVERIRADELDLLIDLRGYTVGDRLEVMARRPAPVQATWLGYPGTTGAPFIDYLIADEVIVPSDHECFYSERVLRLPICYQPNDSRREVAEPLTRREYGLPEGGFVFCCFNQAVKILPEVFDRWMDLLRRVPGSVLWLLHDNPTATDNLRREAEVRGVAPNRLVIGERLPHPQHLARYRVADLSLDTFPYTSHTTANDSLWCGCPLVSLCGETFAARVSASIVASSGFPELVTRSLDAYEALAYSLATEKSKLEQLKAGLHEARKSQARFDSARFATDLEDLFVRMIARG